MYDANRIVPIIWDRNKLQDEYQAAAEIAEDLIRAEIKQNNISSLRSIVMFDIYNTDFDCEGVYYKYTKEIGLDLSREKLQILRYCSGVVSSAYVFGNLEQVMFLRQDYFIFYAIAKNPILWPASIPEMSKEEYLVKCPFTIFHELGHALCHEKTFAHLHIPPDSDDDDPRRVIARTCWSEYFASRFASSCLETMQEEYTFCTKERLLKHNLSTLCQDSVKELLPKAGLLRIFPIFSSTIASYHHFNVEFDFNDLSFFEDILRELGPQYEVDFINMARGLSKMYDLYIEGNYKDLDKWLLTDCYIMIPE